MQFYELQHTRFYAENNFSDQKLIGIYSSLELAQSKQKEFSKKLGFISHLNGFSIKEYTLDIANFQNGFISPFNQ